eukprot:TRINITY_DN10845_c0_g1_i3.p2 TRINITY_DN10845_c0_g1~~TRINITY_DN10845_c0_g1_i3.p2  ORF type:complete len:159 (+),score=15.22 TRINITY_DN10845_c0_g1_i3:148-624(+)
MEHQESSKETDAKTISKHLMNSSHDMKKLLSLNISFEDKASSSDFPLIVFCLSFLLMRRCRAIPLNRLVHLREFSSHLPFQLVVPLGSLSCSNFSPSNSNASSTAYPYCPETASHPLGSLSSGSVTPPHKKPFSMNPCISSQKELSAMRNRISSLSKL